MTERREILFWGREYDAWDGAAQIRRDDGVDVFMACKTLADLGAQIIYLDDCD